MIRLFTLTFTIVTTFGFLNAQTAKPVGVPGYVVASKTGDTLFGEINYLKKTGYRQSMQIKFPDQTTKVCSARNYKFVKAGDDVFVAFAIQDADVTENQFFWRKATGKIDFYEYQYEMYVANNTVTKSEYYIIPKGGGDLIKLNGANFKKKLTEYVKEPKLVDQINSKDTKLEDVEEIVKEYNKGA
jgi:hypothetical protein